ncbi:hypothetical protein C8R44DRAFT_916836 [Mycena epipterygia]|nr:hypothetical protein C8R44DRAFT_916836 [Mycena epipterygia]
MQMIIRHAESQVSQAVAGSHRAPLVLSHRSRTAPALPPWLGFRLIYMIPMRRIFVEETDVYCTGAFFRLGPSSLLSRLCERLCPPLRFPSGDDVVHIERGCPQAPTPSATITPAFPTGTGKISRRDLYLTMIIGQPDPLDEEFTSLSVNMPVGWYVVLASFSPAGPIPRLDVTLPNLATSSGVHLTTSSGPSTGASSPPRATPSMNSRSKLNRGAIVGGVLGAIAVLVAGVSLYLRLKRRLQKDQDLHPSPNMAPPTTKPALPSPAVYGIRSDPYTGNAESTGTAPGEVSVLPPPEGPLADTPHDAYASMGAGIHDDEEKEPLYLPSHPIPSLSQSHNPITSVVHEGSGLLASLRRRQQQVMDTHERGIHGARAPEPAPEPAPAPAPEAQMPIQHVDSGLRMLEPASPALSELPPFTLRIDILPNVYRAPSYTLRDLRTSQLFCAASPFNKDK